MHDNFLVTSDELVSIISDFGSLTSNDSIFLCAYVLFSMSFSLFSPYTVAMMLSIAPFALIVN